MKTTHDLAQCIFPDITITLADLERRFPERNLPHNAEVTRFAPSPTGFLHTGSLFTALVAQKIANQSKGVFYVRLEDTDTKREIKGSGKELLDQLALFDVVPDEGYLGESEKGAYGPYTQSERADIYKVVIKEMLLRGRAYPCFCSKEELDALRTMQEEEKIIPGYYQAFAKCRTISVDEQIAKIEAGIPFVIRFRSEGNHENKIEVTDLVRGDLCLTQNDQDIVIYKSDGLPTYHFAHLVDDHFMRTTIVSRGEEWLSSLPIHCDLFSSMGWQAPRYAHLPVILKLDNGNRRKLSKRKDQEAAISYFLQEGYPKEAIQEYLFTIANSNFEEWHQQNRQLSLQEFPFSFQKMSLDGALFDLAKLQNIAKDCLAYMPKEVLAEKAYTYAKKYNVKLLSFIERDPDFFTSIVGIEKDKENPRKDYQTYGEIADKIDFFYPEVFDKKILEQPLPWNPVFEKTLIQTVLRDFIDTLNLEVDEQAWFQHLKSLGLRYGFAENNKILKANKDLYVGHVGDVAEMVRIALTTSKQSPNIFYVLRILKKQEVLRRITKVIEKVM